MVSLDPEPIRRMKSIPRMYDPEITLFRLAKRPIPRTTIIDAEPKDGSVATCCCPL